MDAATVASSSSSPASDPPSQTPSSNGDRPNKRQRLTPTPPPLAAASLPPVHKNRLEYRGGMFLAPMVRIGCLTTRLLALEYGAGLVWGPEIVDKAMIGAVRTVDERSGTVTYMRQGPKALWTTHPIEKSRLIYQIGSADKDLALQAALTVAQDVSGIDLNCGCPKSFSTKGGMGAALLKEPDKLCGILRHLVDHLPTMLISCKIRLLPSQDDTLSLVSQIVSTGISCLTVHCRTQSMRSTEPALLHRLRDVVELVDRLTSGRVPVVANGDCWDYEDVERIKAETGVTSVMTARGAEANVSIFRKEGKLDPASQVMPFFVKVAIATDQSFGLAKYCILTMDLKSGRAEADGAGVDKQSRKTLKSRIGQARSWEDLGALFGLDDVGQARLAPLEKLLPETARWEDKARAERTLAGGMVDASS